LDTEQLSTGRVVYTIDEGPRVRIVKVSFRGNRAIKTAALKGAIKTRTTEWFIFPAYYVEERPFEDEVRLQNIYQAKGFLDARITARLKFSEDKRKVRITFVIDEGPFYAIERIVLTGNENFDEKQLRLELKLEEGQIYNERKAASDVNRLLKFYRENGFIDAKVGRKRGFVSEGEVNVEFEITEGERLRIGRVNITGNEETQDKVIRRVLDEYDFRPGRWYNADIARGDGSGYLEKLLRRNTLAETATITPSGEMPGQRDAQVSIVEGQTGAWGVTGAVSSDRGLVGGLIYEEHNFDIGDWPESLGELLPGPKRAFRGAGQKVRVALTPGTREGGYSVSFTESYLNDKPISLDVSGSIYKIEGDGYDEMSYDKDRTRGYVGFDKRYKNGWRRSVSFRVENVELHSLEPNSPREITDAEGDNLIAGIKFGIRRDLTDDIFHPSRGYRFSIGYEQVSGDDTFGILSGTYKHYGTLYEDLAERKTILSTKLLAATVLGDAPPFEKFYAGGMGTYGIRGFDYWGVSTRGRNPVTGEKKYPVGSDWIFLANAEVAVPLVSEEVSALFFVDSGTIDSGNYRASVGTGIQIQIPRWFGPVPMRIGVAVPFLKDDIDDTEAFFFSVGRLF
ncbi:MAG: BamA/OMP85 family outer membrane protein, partial [Planctomycetota bacterium]